MINKGQLHAVPSENQRALKKAVAHQPVASAIQANQRDFQLYMGGVLTAPCGTELDHGVLIVGYGRENHTDYWLIKNSWGKHWGDDGYIKILRTDEDGPGQCGVAEGPSYPIKWHENPPRPPKPGNVSNVLSCYTPCACRLGPTKHAASFSLHKPSKSKNG
jgi:KDEL-tailed cysteine endopeptidase